MRVAVEPKTVVPGEVAVVEDDPIAGRLLAAVLRKAGFRPRLFAGGHEALEAMNAGVPDAVCLDVLLPGASGEEVFLDMRARYPELPIIVLSGQHSVERAVEIMKLRPFDYFVKPFDHERLVRSVDAAVRQHRLARRVQQLEREVHDTFRFEEIIGQSPRMRQLYDQIEKVLDNPVPVFIHGESGTGKELVAKAIHYNGIRRNGPFVTLNCGAIAETLQESELFGHERGAFTGAVGLYRGRFEQAHGGTLFLDEVGELSPAVQTRLLRVLQEGTIQRLGGSQTLKVDVRIISATHRDMDQLVEAGTMRQDLYYRLMVFPLDIPPLRERREDIPLLLPHLIRKHQLPNTRPPVFDPDALDVLCRYDYPGNVRELENVVLRTLVSNRGGRIGVSDLPPHLVLRAMGLPLSTAPQADAGNDSAPVPSPDEVVPLEELERRAITHAIRAFDGNMSLVARRLGLGRATLYRKLALFGIRAPGAEAEEP